MWLLIDYESYINHKTIGCIVGYRNMWLCISDCNQFQPRQLVPGVCDAFLQLSIVLITVARNMDIKIALLVAVCLHYTGILIFVIFYLFNSRFLLTSRVLLWLWNFWQSCVPSKVLCTLPYIWKYIYTYETYVILLHNTLKRKTPK